MWERKILYQGNAQGLFEYDAFIGFMKEKGQRLPLDNNSLYRMELFVVEPDSTLIYTARKRLVPRNLDLWYVAVTLAGYGVEAVEKKLNFSVKY